MKHSYLIRNSALFAVAMVAFGVASFHAQSASVFGSHQTAGVAPEPASTQTLSANASIGMLSAIRTESDSTLLVDTHHNDEAMVSETVVNRSHFAASGSTSSNMTLGDASLPTSRIPWQGGAWYLNGANLPWYNWACDFGCGSSGGVSDTTVNAQLRTAFQQAHNNGVHVVRWWVFEGDAKQVLRDANGVPTGLNPAVYADFDAALQLAQTYDIYLEFTLFSSPTAIPTSWLTNQQQLSALSDALAPLFARYGNNPHLMSWDLFNEPEWDINNGKIAKLPVQQAVETLATAVHANSSALVTVGSGMLSGVSLWTGLGLDYYEAHWYDYMSQGQDCAICTDAPSVSAQMGLDKPIVIGEFPTGSAAEAASRFAGWYSKGYAGALGWSLLPDHTGDHLAVDLPAVQAFSATHADAGPIGTQPTAASRP
jgi:Cellulase (glycosyl hydrolase family 5)